jgi:hypothetical protein
VAEDAVSCPGPMHSADTVPMDTDASEEDGVSRQKWPVGLAEMAEMFGIEKNTPTRWLYRSRKGLMDPRLPEPDGHVSATVPFWWHTTVERWAKASKRQMVRRVGARGEWFDVKPDDAWEPEPEEDVAPVRAPERVPDGVPIEFREPVPAGR